MTSIAKLKDRARKYEQKEDWRSAIEAYREVLEQEEAEDEIELELGLFNRVGDLYLRLGQTDDAVAYYERAADKYAESGFYNNAIALCNKALRHRPDRPDTYLKLSHFCQQQGFATDARRWILAYAERQVKRGQVEQALSGLRTFVQSANAPDVRELLAQHLAARDHADEAIGQLRQAYAEWSRRGDADAADRVARHVRELDPDVDLTAGPGAEAGTLGDLPGLDEPEDGVAAWKSPQDDPALRPPAAVGLEGLETHRIDDLQPPAGSVSDTDEVGDPVSEPQEEDALGGLETFGFDRAAMPTPAEDSLAGAGVDPVPDAGATPEQDEDEPVPLPLLDTGFAEEGGSQADPLPLLDQAFPPLDERAADDPGIVGPGDEVGEPGEGVEEDVAVLGPAASVDRAAQRESEHEIPTPAHDEGDPAPTEGPDELSESARPAATGPAVGEPRRGEDEQEEAGIGSLDLEDGFLVGGAVGFGVEIVGDEGEDEPLILDLGGPKIQSEDVKVDVDAILNRAKELVSRGLVAEASSELRILSVADTHPDELRQALTVTNELVRRNPNDLPILQRRVEFATQIGDRLLLVDTYMDLAGALARTGAESKAQAMYQRVLGLDPQNTAALDAVGGKGGAEEEIVDLEAVLRDITDGGELSSGGGRAEGGENLAAMFSQIKPQPGGADSPEDSTAHYDLGLAFREMGLIDEAIGEFQTALRAGKERLKVYEELGQCFMMKNQYVVAVKVLRRALQAPRQSDADLLGVFYQLGLCHEHLGQRRDARDAYERVMAIDPGFKDVGTRVGRL
jgi:tetratricopeptide (TPR) repeat protein